MDAFQQMYSRPGEHQIAFGRLFLKGLGDRWRRTKAFGQCVGDIGQRIPRPAGYDEFAFPEERFRIAPGCDLAECVDADQEEQPIAFLERLLESFHRIDGIVDRG